MSHPGGSFLIRHRWLGRIGLVALLAPALAGLVLLAGEGVAWLSGREAPAYFEAAQDLTGRLLWRASDHPPIPRTAFRVPEFSQLPHGESLRILCVGGSSVYGHPFDPPAPFASWLEVRLAQLFPERSFEVLNLGSNAFNSEAIRDLLEDVQWGAADLLVVYAGHNEFLDRNLPSVLYPRRHRLHHWLRSTRLGSWLQDLLRTGSEGDPLPAHVMQKARIHDAPFLNEEHLRRGLEDYRHAMSRIVGGAVERGATVALCLPVADLRDVGVEYSSFAATTPAAAREVFRQEVQLLRADLDRLEAAGGETSAIREACQERLQRLEAIDGSVPLLAFLRGRFWLISGEREAARAELLRARDADQYPIRATGRIHAVLREIAASDDHVILVDPQPYFDAAAEPDLPGQNGFFTDYCHPDLLGHRLIAESILRALAAHSVFEPTPRWRFGDEPSFEEYTARMGLSDRAQAESFARRALFALGKSYFQNTDRENLRDAAGWFDLSRKLDPDCALAWAGLGVIAAIHGETEPALEHFEKAYELDPSSCAMIAAAYQSQESVRALFHAAAVGFEDGQAVRLRP